MKRLPLTAATMTIIGILFYAVIRSRGPAMPPPAPGHSVLPLTSRIKTTLVQGEVQMDVGDIGTLTNAPLEMLSSVLQRDKQAQRFRVKWKASVLSLGFHATAVYDRRQKTVRYRCIGGSHGGLIDDYILFRGVSDAILLKLAKERKTAGTPHAGLEELPRYGCGRRELPTQAQRSK